MDTLLNAIAIALMLLPGVLGAVFHVPVLITLTTFVSGGVCGAVFFNRMRRWWYGS